MFRQYQVKSPTALQLRSEAIRNDQSRRGQRSAMSESMGSSTADANGNGARTEYAQFNEEDMETRSTNIFNRWRERFDDSFYTSSEGEGVDEDDDDAESEDGGVWAPETRSRGEFPSPQPFSQHPISIGDMDIEHLEHHNVMSLHPSFGLRHFSNRDLGQSRVSESQLSSDVDGDDDDEEEYEDNESLESSSVSELLQAGRERVSSESHARLLNARSSDLRDVQLSSPLIGASNHDPSVPNDFVSVGDEDEIAQTADESEKPWRSYCEELIARNREMQEQVAYARRRIVQLDHNNQKLHLLIDRVERDRDGLMFENDLLQTQLNGYEDHARHHAALTKELTVLRKCLKKKVSGLKESFQDPPFSLHRDVEPKHSMMNDLHASSSSASLDDVRFVFQQQLSSRALTSKSFDELKDWEQLLESSLASVRAMKEEKALELQKRLDRQVEEQQELKLCVICLSNEKSILCLPCRHLCLCESCSAHEEVEKCPICRLHIDEMLLVYA
ncbi:Ring zinc finger-containing protein, partial [Globisporangium splendens]